MFTAEDRANVSTLVTFSLCLVLSVGFLIFQLVVAEFKIDLTIVFVLVALLSFTMLWNTWQTEWRVRFFADLRIKLKERTARRAIRRSIIIETFRLVLMVNLVMLNLALLAHWGLDTPGSKLIIAPIMTIVMTQLLTELIGRIWKHPV